MIETVEVENFQSHKHTTINLSPGVNVFKGRSHSGKSSIVRAIRWNLLNKPRGSHFMSHFSGSKEVTSVGLQFMGDEYTIRERRGVALNGYDSSVGTFAAMRSDVPEEIQDITKMNEINIQTQGDPYFMLNKTAGQVAKELNQLVGLDIIDNTLGRLNRVENEAGAKLNVLEDQLDKDEEELTGLDFVDDLDSRVSKIEKLWERYNKVLAQKVSLSDAKDKIHDLGSDIKEITEWLTIEEPFKEIKTLVEKRVSLLVAYRKLEKMYADIKRAETSLSRSDRLVLQLNDKLLTIKKSKEYIQSFCRYCGAHKDHWRTD